MSERRAEAVALLTREETYDPASFGWRDVDVLIFQYGGGTWNGTPLCFLCGWREVDHRQGEPPTLCPGLSAWKAFERYGIPPFGDKTQVQQG